MRGGPGRADGILPRGPNGLGLKLPISRFRNFVHHSNTRRDAQGTRIPSPACRRLRAAAASLAPECVRRVPHRRTRFYRFSAKPASDGALPQKRVYWKTEIGPLRLRGIAAQESVGSLGALISRPELSGPRFCSLHIGPRPGSKESRPLASNRTSKPWSHCSDFRRRSIGRKK